MIFSQRSFEGCLTIDHRASPGFRNEATARKLGYEPAMVKEGAFTELVTLSCIHCNAIVILNPARKRERGHCFKCNRYVCDYCNAAMRAPGYVHRPFAQIKDMVGSGKYRLNGPLWKPVLTPNGE